MKALKLFLPVLLAAVSNTWAAPSASEKPVAMWSYPDLQEYATHIERPVYPNSQKAKKHVGKGIFTMNIQPKSGAVTSVTIRRSTGHRELDQACVDALIRWRFRTGGIPKVTVPIEFTMESGFNLSVDRPYPYMRRTPLSKAALKKQRESR